MEDKGLKRVKSLSKSKLIERLTEYMLKPEEMERYFLCMNDTQIRQFESAADGKRVFHEGDSDGLFQLHAAAYVGLLEDGTYVVPVDVREAYNRIDTIEFHKKRRKVSFLYDCTIAAGNWYGITPIRVFKQITEQCLFMENISEANHIGMTIQDLLRVDCSMDEVFGLLGELESFEEDKKRAIRLVDIIVELDNNTRKISNRGFTPNEMGIGIKPKQSNKNVVSIEEARRKKVYANDPCPCGSGLKYKKCCGRKK